MTRVEALERFREEQEAVLVRSPEATWARLEEFAPRLREVVREGFLLLGEEIERKKKRELEYFQFSVLRTDLIQKRYTLLLHGYGKRWYTDEEAACAVLSMDDWIEDRVPSWERLYLDAKKYMGRVNRHDVDYLMLEQIIGENKLIAHALRFLLSDVEEEAAFAAIPKEALYQIRFGEYRDRSELVFRTDRSAKTPGDWEEALRRARAERDRLVYSCWYGARLEGGSCEGLACHYIRFEECGLRNLGFRQAALMGARFLNCRLEGCDFGGADLSHADFTGTRAEDCDFAGASLAGAVFSEEAVPCLRLMPEQLRQIRIGKEERGCAISR